MPKCCGDCPLLESGYGHCELGIKIAFLSEKASDCPLKSTDEMITEIDDYKIMVNPIGYILRVIHKYCDKEST